MRAQNLTIAIPNKGCDKNCPYCVSKMTGAISTNETLLLRNLPKVKRIARAAQVTSVLLTGKGEPTLNLPWTERLIEEFAEWPVELQTNGLRLAADMKNHNGAIIDKLAIAGLNLLAFSLDQITQFDDLAPMFSALRKRGILVRVTLNVTDLLDAELTFDEALQRCKQSQAQQFSLRQITIPNHVNLSGDEASAVASWIKTHGKPELYDKLVGQMKERSTHLLRELPYGAKVYDVDGVAVTYFDYCVQDNHGDDDVRSLILQEDGHLYTSWNSLASALF